MLGTMQRRGGVGERAGRGVDGPTTISRSLQKGRRRVVAASATAAPPTPSPPPPPRSPSPRPLLPDLDAPALLSTVLGTTGDDELLRETKLGQAVISDGGPARLFSPLPSLDDGDAKPTLRAPAANAPSAATATPPLPLMFYLPGLDGSGLAASNQFGPLSRAFELRCLALPPSDRMTFEELAAHVAALVAADVERDCFLPSSASGSTTTATTPTPTTRRRPVYLLGESFGGVLALAVAERLGPRLVDRLVLVNPATSFGESIWPRAGGLLANLPDELYRALPLALSPVLSNPLALAQAQARAEAEARERAKAREQDEARRRRDEEDGGGAAAEADPEEQDPVPEPVRRASDALYALIGLVPQLSALRLVLPRETLAHRLTLLQEGSEAARALLPRVQQRALILAGELDLLIPSAEEAKKLESAMPRARSVVLKGRSHALLQEDGVDLVRTLQQEGFYVRQRLFSSDGPLGGWVGDDGGEDEGEDDNAKNNKKKQKGLRGGRIASAVAGAFGTPAPIELPTPRELELDAQRFVTPLRRLTSPVFFSTDPRTGAVRQGLDAVPVGKGQGQRPVLLVGNHQLFAADMYSLVYEFLSERGVMLRGLAHPVVFGGGGGGFGGGGSGEGEGDGESGGGNDGSNNTSNGPVSFGAFLSTYGAVPVSPFNLHALLAAGETALLFPGGAREAFKRRGEEYKLVWPERSEFVRMAARFGADVVPFSAVGADEAVVQLLSGPELAELRERVPKPVRDAAEGLLFRRGRDGRSGGRSDGGNGDGSGNGSRPLPVARKGVNAQAFDEDAFANALPLIAPNGLPRRLYFKFGAPIRTTPEMAADRAACDAAYAKAKAEVEQGLEWLLRKRAEDPYGDFAPRVLYEAAPWNAGRQAPTFRP